MISTGYSVPFFRYTTVLFLVVLAGCATQRNAYQIIEKTDLPVYRGDAHETQLDLRVLFHVMEGGSVNDVRLLTKTRNSDWDAAVSDSLKKWRFSTPHPDSTFWMSMNLRVIIVQSELMNIGELISENREPAQDLYNRLRSGTPFDQLVDEARSGVLPGIWGRYKRDVNIEEYPMNIRAILRDLEAGTFTRPLRVGREYIIYKRLDDDDKNARELHL